MEKWRRKFLGLLSVLDVVSVILYAYFAKEAFEQPYSELLIVAAACSVGILIVVLDREKRV